MWNTWRAIVYVTLAVVAANGRNDLFWLTETARMFYFNETRCVSHDWRRKMIYSDYAWPVCGGRPPKFERSNKHSRETYDFRCRRRGFDFLARQDAFYDNFFAYCSRDNYTASAVENPDGITTNKLRKNISLRIESPPKSSTRYLFRNRWSISVLFFFFSRSRSVTHDARNRSGVAFTRNYHAILLLFVAQTGHARAAVVQYCY